MLMTKAFRDQNPKIAGAIYAAIEEANALINTKPAEAADIYIKATGEKRTDRTKMEKIVADPDNVWTTTPQYGMKYVNFMHKVGTAKKIPNDWKELFMPEVHALPGS